MDSPLTPGRSGVVRPGVEADLPSLIAIDPITQGDAQRSELLTASVERGECLVYEDRSAISGLVIVRHHHFFERDFVELLVVTAQRRRLGIGRQLLAAAIGARGTDAIFTSTNQSNWPMRTLLEEGGWSLSGRLEGLDGGDPELVYFWKDHH